MKLLIVLAFLVPCALCFTGEDRSRQCWSSATNQAARWWNEGERIDRGKYWYECRAGELQPKGCFSPTGQRVNLYDTFTNKGYQQRCVLNGQHLGFEYTACAPEGVGIKNVGEQWEDSQRMYYFECEKDGEYLKNAIGGCMSHDKTRKIPLNEEYESGEYVYTCLKKHTGSVQMCSTGCVHNGRRYKVGDQWPDGDFTYYCKLENGRCQKVCIGCEFENRRLFDGDRYTKGETVFQCEIRQDSFKHKPVACVDEASGGITRKIGCVWDRQDPNSKVELCCKLDEAKGETYVECNGCIYQHNGYDTLFIEPGTYTIWTPSLDVESKAYACKEIGHKQYRLETFEVDQVAQRAFSLKYSTPKGRK